ncbi:protein TILLER ANGLE CONTROL 1-like [Impatiens glandulifera]|uniref:protein TILLER ANGLE CONTROL 1-like n=1 Tax=Impatiens glandulifera TaxID=253017 RepID=UPI001FB12094|nr:protein TILLER ANGLE CONTROL 1-like [Impatiens glandulifera]
MMIFNWVNRKLHQKDERPQFSSDGNIKGKQEYDRNYKNMLYDDITEWSADNILAIGTLGFVDLGFGDRITTKTVVAKEVCLINNGYDVDVDDEHDHDIDSNNVVVQDGHDLNQYDQIKPMMKKKEERTTLADLFSAEYSCDSGTITNNHKIPITATTYDKSGDNKRDYMTSKKLVPLPVKKFHKLMKRMLNRKIHPELIGKLDIIQNDGEPISKSFQQDGVENAKSMSLLPIGDVV